MACHQGSFECRRRTPCTCKIDDGGCNPSRDVTVSDVVVLVAGLCGIYELAKLTQERG
jgi:hypothetical protein